MLLFLIIALVFINCKSSKYRLTNRKCQDQHQRVCNYQLTYNGTLNFDYAEIRKQLEMKVVHNSANEVSIKIHDKAMLNYQIPSKQPYLSKTDHLYHMDDNQQQQYQFQFNDDPFSFDISSSDKQTIFNSSVDDLIFSDSYLSLSTSYESEYGIFGFSDHQDQFRLYEDQNYTSYSSYDYFKTFDPFQPSSSSQNSVLFKSYNNQSNYIILFRTSSPMNLTIDSKQDKKVHFKMFGGIIDMKVFIHREMKHLLQIYSNYLGKHAVPPFWSMGYIHQEFWAQNKHDLQEIIDNFKNNSIQIDATFMTDMFLSGQIQTSAKQQIFSNEKWKQFLRRNELKVIITLQPGISSSPFQHDDCQGELNMALIEGIQENVFVKDKYRNKEIEMLVRINKIPVYIVDFTNPNASIYWERQIKRLQQQIYFDGISLENNELTLDYPGNYNLSHDYYLTFAGDYRWANYSQECELKRVQLPFMPILDCLYHQSIDTDQEYYDGTQELYMHNVYNLHQSKSTVESLKAIGNDLPFVMSHSTTMNSHKYQFAHNHNGYATWQKMRQSIFQILRHSFHGIQMNGHNICGVLRIPDGELCSRWYQLGTVYPLAKHYGGVIKHLSPFQQGRITKIAIQKSISLRYSLLRYLYLQMLTKNKKGFIWRHFTMYFEKDPQLRKGLLSEFMNYQFMVGNALLATPIVHESAIKRSIHIPKNHSFYDLHTGKCIHMETNRTANDQEDNNRDYIRVHKITNHCHDYIPLFIRIGKIVQVQNTQNVRNTYDLGKNVTLKVALNHHRNSTGEIILLGNLSDEKQVNHYCVNQECLSKIEFIITTENRMILRMHIDNYQMYKELVKRDKIVNINRLHIYSHKPINEEDQLICLEIVMTDKQYVQKYGKRVIECQKTKLTKKVNIYVSDNRLSIDHNGIVEQLQLQLE